MQADIRAFFRTLAAAQEDGRRLLFAAGDRAGIRHDVGDALASVLGGMRGDRWFRFRASTLPRLPARLRVLVGCAEVLQGGVEACDFVDVDLEGPRIAMVTCDDIARPIPFMVERIVVDLVRQRVSADRREPLAAPVYFKARFLAADDELRVGQEQFESDLIDTGLFSSGLPEPTWEAVQTALKRRSPDISVALRSGAE
jgi:hypothetical protein